MAKEIPWKTLSEAYAFIGNSLLKPMTMTSTVGLDPAFWEAFPSFDDEAVAEAVAACARYAEGAVQRAEAGEDEPQRAAVEYTKLFVGPPSPAAAPWETMYRGKNVTVGFGQATFEMRELLREAGLEVRNVNNQYEDHLGIELGRRVPRAHRRGGARRLLRLACRVGSSSARLACRSAARVGGSHGLPCNDRFARGFGHRRQRR